MLIRMLKLKPVLFLLVLFFILTTCVFSDDFWESSYTPYLDKKCDKDNPQDPEIEHDGNNPLCSTITTKTKCENAKKPKYTIKKTDGCTVGASDFTDSTGRVWTHYCYIATGKYSWGTVKCKFVEIEGQDGNCENDENSWSKKKKDVNRCRDKRI